METKSTLRKNTGAFFVIALLILAVLGSALTRWHYGRTRPSTNDATIQTDGGSKWWAEARYTEQQAKIIRPGMMATVTLKQKPDDKIEAYVENLTPDGTNRVSVRLRLPAASYIAGAPCAATVDASVSPEMLKAETIPKP